MNIHSLVIKTTLFLALLFTGTFQYLGPEEATGGRSIVLISGIAFFITSIFFIQLQQKINLFRLDQYLWIFFFFAIASSLINLNFLSFITTLIFFLNTVCIFQIFNNSKFQKNSFKLINKIILIVTGFLTSLYLSSFFIHGVDFFAGRNVGNFHPNHYGIQGFTLLSLVFFSTKNFYIRFLYIILCFFFPLIVISRGSLVAIILFLLLYFFLLFFDSNNIRKVIFNLLVSIFFICFITIFFLTSLETSLNVILAYLDLTDSTRGFSSGFTGRDNVWSKAFLLFYDRPLFGYGLDSISIQIHSSPLVLLLGTGAFGFLFFSLGVFSIISKLFKKLFVIQNDKLIVSFAFVCSALIYGLIENMLFEFSQPLSLLFFFYLSYIYYFNKNYQLSDA
jgi:O-antigen ligase